MNFLGCDFSCFEVCCYLFSCEDLGLRVLGFVAVHNCVMGLIIWFGLLVVCWGYLTALDLCLVILDFQDLLCVGVLVLVFSCLLVCGFVG